MNAHVATPPPPEASSAQAPAASSLHILDATGLLAGMNAQLSPWLALTQMHSIPSPPQTCPSD
jgi:hypothetical protein